MFYTELILFEGGGYMSDIWYGPVLIQQISKRNPQPIAIAPQSYLFEKTDLNNFFKDGREVTLFCRERFSIKHLEELRLSPNIEIELSQDTALYLEKKDLEKYIKPCDEDYDLIAFRKDRESILTDKTRKKVLEECKNPFEKDISMTKQLEDFVSMVANANKVYTDRLHVAILAKIMNKKTKLYPNKYYKNLGVWEYSLKDSITFVNEKNQ
jgi:exopolysaccharide biosynthesis predicted pyruvyltransferase EpsI